MNLIVKFVQSVLFVREAAVTSMILIDNWSVVMAGDKNPLSDVEFAIFELLGSGKEIGIRDIELYDFILVSF
jgi:hypothetical protein